MVILHFYGARAIFVLFCNHQDTDYELCEIDIIIYHTIFAHKNIKGSMGKLYPYSTRWEKILW